MHNFSSFVHKLNLLSCPRQGKQSCLRSPTRKFTCENQRASLGNNSVRNAVAREHVVPTHRLENSKTPFTGETEYDDGEANVLLNPRQKYSEQAIQDILSSTPFTEDPPGHRSGFVAIIGLPNAGKSTLLNALVGQKLAIVSPKAQSTRRRVVGIVSEEDYQLILVDTPGALAWHRNPLERKMMSYVKGSMREADAIVAIVDASQEHRQQEVLDMIQPPPPPDVSPPLLVVLNKVDKLTARQSEELKDWWQENCRCNSVFLASATERQGIFPIRDWMVNHIPEGPTLYSKDQVSEQPEKFFVAEIFRERIFELYQQEIPYVTQVNVLDFKERPKGKDYILCELVVERQNQKSILLGRKGVAIKALCTSARADIEEYLQRPVYIQTMVRVDQNWRKKAKSLEQFGY